jgi:hypothetical protein
MHNRIRAVFGRQRYPGGGRVGGKPNANVTESPGLDEFLVGFTGIIDQKVSRPGGEASAPQHDFGVSLGNTKKLKTFVIMCVDVDYSAEVFADGKNAQRLGIDARPECMV